MHWAAVSASLPSHTDACATLCRAPGFLLHDGLTVRRAPLPHGGAFERARARRSEPSDTQPTDVPSFALSSTLDSRHSHSRREDTNVSRARYERARSHLAHEVDASDQATFHLVRAQRARVRHRDRR